jgi:nitroimidazol reductase NimA-like FMN-containing flavoprotein (pyridoxamine 5'-phosphate oxidase superfamily)
VSTSPSDPATPPTGPSAPASSATATGPARPAGPTSERVRLRRKRERGSYDRMVIDAILDEALIAHLGIVEDGRPLVIPTLHVRCGDVVYCHGSVASRTLRALAGGAPACLTVSLADGVVLARAAMHHSVNYRSVMIVGEARSVESFEEKRAALRAVVEHVVPGRASEVREPSENELRATAVLALPLEEFSAKLRSGPPLDDEADYALDAWAGVIPLRSAAGPPEPDPRLRPGIELPAHVSAYRRPSAPRPRR